MIPLPGPAQTTVLSLRVDAVAAEVIEALEEAGIRPVLLKGASFAAWLYPDGAQRAYQDVDLLVEPASFGPAREVLRGRGFRDSFTGPEGLSETLLRRGDWIPVDLHRSLRGTGVSPQTVWEILSEHVSSLRVGGRDVAVLSEPAQAFVVAEHAFRHQVTATAASREDLLRAIAQVDLATWREGAELAARLQGVPWFVAGLCVLPEGRALAERLGLPIEDAIRAAGAPPAPLTSAQQLAATEGLAPRIRLIVRRLLPSPVEMRLHSRLANRGTAGLALAYLWRLLLLPIRLPRAVLARRRARAGASE